MSKLVDITGERFGCLTVIRRDGVTKSGAAAWLCKCDCGQYTIAAGNHLRQGLVKSCGCARKTAHRIDITGQRFGKLVAIEPIYGDITYWRCKCDCGNETSVRMSNLRSGGVISCGCASSRLYSGEKNPSYKHGNAHCRLYAVWASMIQRCENENNSAFKNYGGRGISVCDEWHDYATFEEWALSSGYDESAPKGKCTIDRINNNGNYEPSNCRWVDMHIQALNKKR